MARILIKADKTGVGPGAYDAGDVVVIKPDAHVWGLKEGPPRFIVIEAPGIHPRKLREYLRSQRDGRGTMTRRRNWKFNRLNSKFMNKDTLVEETTDETAHKFMNKDTLVEETTDETAQRN